jgi:hypothetical protein
LSPISKLSMTRRFNFSSLIWDSFIMSTLERHKF